MMTKTTHWIYIFATFVLSGISVALLIVSISTNQWIKSEAYNAFASQNSEITYGLFSGSLTRYLLSTPQKFDLTVTCDYGEGKCFYSCHTTLEKRHKELENIMKNQTLESCSPKLMKYFIPYTPNKNKKPVNVNEQFIGSGFWVCTLMFLIIAIIFSVISAILSLVNIIMNPVNIIFSIFGLYIWNSIVASSCFFIMVIWGSLYDVTLSDNIAIADTLTFNDTYYSSGLAKLGYSYFIIIIPLLFSSVNIALLTLRRYLLKRDLEPTVITVGSDKYDTTITFY